MINAVMFDFDGVVVNSEPVHLRSFRDIFGPLGIRINTKRWYRDFTGKGSRYIITQLLKEKGLDYNVDEWLAKRKQKYHEYIAQGKLKPIKGIKKFLILLRKKGIKTAIVSGGHGENVKAALEKTGLNKYFDTIIALEDVTNGKPAPDGFLLAAQKLMVRPEDCIAIEDSPAGVQSAKAAGMILVCMKSHCPIDDDICDYKIADYNYFPKDLLG